ncbi:unnamed protein product [Heligmosomoides polygyrus]|uniref:Uncharacterized protein n=1 Tax=Heligmosomoides polygyrus TaxID=6339 RepID=A0A183FSA4_HELPZ|nr:unnamed protein product [Heligmosomoides polygyrus]
MGCIMKPPKFFPGPRLAQSYILCYSDLLNQDNIRQQGENAEHQKRCVVQNSHGFYRYLDIGTGQSAWGEWKLPVDDISSGIT